MRCWSSDGRSRNSDTGAFCCCWQDEAPAVSILVALKSSRASLDIWILSDWLKFARYENSFNARREAKKAGVFRSRSLRSSSRSNDVKRSNPSSCSLSSTAPETALSHIERENRWQFGLDRYDAKFSWLVVVRSTALRSRTRRLLKRPASSAARRTSRKSSDNGLSDKFRILMDRLPRILTRLCASCDVPHMLL